MRSLLCFATVGVMAFAATGNTQETDKGETTKAMYFVKGMHCELCGTALEGSLKKVRGVASIMANVKGQYAVIEFKENLISAQEVARAISNTQHMMGPNMQYAGALLLSVDGFPKDKTTGKKAMAALRTVKGVGKVTPYPQQKALAIEFMGKEKVTTRQLLEALEKAGLKGTQYGTASGSGAQTMNGENGSMRGHAGIAMNNDANSGPMAGCGKGPKKRSTHSTGRSMNADSLGNGIGYRCRPCFRITPAR